MYDILLPIGMCSGSRDLFKLLAISDNGRVLLLPRTAPERSRLVSDRSFSTDETSPSALTLLRPKRATKRIATPTCILFCAAMENSDEMYVFVFFVHI